MEYVIYTDGAYSTNANIGGIGFAIYKDNALVCQFGKAYENTTNNRMEIMACIVALASLKEPSEVDLYSDSMYVVGTMTSSWKRNYNQDLWYKLDKLVKKHNVKFIHIKGHDGNQRNELVDNLATGAISKQSGGSL